MIEAAKRLRGPQPATGASERYEKSLPEKCRTPKFLETRWQQSARQLVGECKASLWSKSGEPGIRYLVGDRGLEESTLRAFDVGFDSREATDGRPAVALPWMLPDGSLTAVKFRYIDELSREKGLRFTQLVHSSPVIFGGQTLQFGELLILIEGEINCMSVWQACHRHGIDCVSFGSQSNESGIKSASKLVGDRRYREVLIWCDELEHSIRAGKVLSDRRPRLMKSPGGRDANDVLRQFGAGGLLELIELQLNRTIAKTYETNRNDARTRVLRIIDRIYEHSGPSLKAPLQRLDFLVKAGEPKDAAEAIQLAEKIGSICGAPDIALSGAALSARIREVFTPKEETEAGMNCE